MEKLDTITSIPKSYLPAPPASKQKWHQKITIVNASVIAQKPWTAGLLDSIIAVDLFFKHSLSQKNRICLIILDSTIEIAYKEYLINEKNIGNRRFKNIAENRADVEREVKKYLNIDQKTIQKINYYYKLRCDLIHERATPNITDPQIEDYRAILEGLLQDMFGLKLK